MKARPAFPRILLLCFTCLAFAVCDGGKQRPAVAPAADTAGGKPVFPAVFPHEPDAVIRAGSSPLWFEFTADFPRQIQKIEDAALVDFTPWPYALFATGILPFEEGICAVVNRYGFFSVLPGLRGELFLYAFKEEGYFPHYTASAPFYYDENPSVILSGNDFFFEAGLQPPKKRIFSVETGHSALLTPEIPAFESFSADSFWDFETFFSSAEGLWYFKARKKAKDSPQIFYGRTSASGKSGKVEEISQAALYEARAPSRPEKLPAIIQPLFERSGFSLREWSAQDLVWTLLVSSKDEYCNIVFSNKNETDNEQNASALYALYDEDVTASRAVLLVPERPENPGAAAFALFYGEDNTAQKQPLPLLPENFFWTAAGICAGTLFAFWEERDNWNIGAAGFCAIALGTR